MDNSIYISLSRQMTLFRDMEATANNVANLNTAGFQAERLLFSDYLQPDGRKLGSKMAFADDPISYRDMTQASTRPTGNPFDMAINGPGYFQIETPLGPRYTRAGNFQLNTDGTLVTVDGFPVLSADGGQITLPPDIVSIRIDGAGNLLTENGELIATVGMFEFANDQAMERVGNTMFKTDQAAEAAQQSRLIQGMLEGSNVNGVTEIVKVIQVNRSVSDTAKMIETMYDLQRKTSTTYARPAQG
ncbi:MAG: flagellar basal-body rod protein FlgF [Alphaproteobacteria bacterium]